MMYIQHNLSTSNSLLLYENRVFKKSTYIYFQKIYYHSCKNSEFNLIFFHIDDYFFNTLYCVHKKWHLLTFKSFALFFVMPFFYFILQLFFVCPTPKLYLQGEICAIYAFQISSFLFNLLSLLTNYFLSGKKHFE